MNALGQHVLAELHGASPDHLNDPAFLERTLVATAQAAGATVVESSFNPFAPHGVTGIIIIQESHLALHTWPEHGYAALDVFTCSLDVDAEQIAQAFAKEIRAERCETKHIERGEGLATTDSEDGIPQGTTKRSVWFTDRQDNIALSLRHTGVLFNEQSAYQSVEVLSSEGYGKILLLDDQVAFTERDENVYHEMIAHVPMQYHQEANRILIIGGGDGGACREFLKHESVESITVVEIDPTVTEASREHFPQMSSSLDDSRVTLIHGDGQAFLSSADANFDIIAIDCMDTAGDSPFDQGFFDQIRAALSPGGLTVSQVCAPTLSPNRFSQSVAEHRESYPCVRPYLGYLPTYSTGMLSFLLSGETIPDTPRTLPSSLHTQYVNDRILDAAFALPTSISQLTKE
jgi:spermidine synthase